jgi:hypothetical protein
MLSNLTRFTTKEAFDAILLSTILESESAKPALYLDNATPKNPTIGIGCNLTNIDVLGAVMVGFGYVKESGSYDADIVKLHGIFTSTKTLATMKTEADKIIAASLGAGKTFAFSSGADGQATMHQVFMNLAPTFAKIVVDRSSAPPVSPSPLGRRSW